MDYTHLGRSGLRVSRLCLGTMNFGGVTDEKTAFRIMDMALDAGINFFDTADVYGNDQEIGATESLIGRWFAQGGHRREKIVLATKAFGNLGDADEGPNGQDGLSTYKIRRHLEGSLRRLQTDHLELYYMHHIDRQVSWTELWSTYEALFQQGKIDYVGSSNFAGWHLLKAQMEAEKRGFLGLVSEQHRYNLNCRLPELEVLPAARDQGIGILPWSPLDGGTLGRNALKKSGGIRTGWSSEKIAAHSEQLKAFDSLCQEIGIPQDVIALAWLLDRPGVDAPIIGPRTTEQLTDALEAVTVTMTDDIRSRLEEIFPGPGGEAPEAYSW